jgi:CheY-like chemotaxis protein/HPt (histidine-containing phosphotransfer) domain-containing protein
MPDVDGFMLARRVRREPRLAKLPIVMLTSAGQSDAMMRRQRQYIDAFLTKPIKHSDLLEALGGLFGVATRHGRTEPTPARIGPRPARALRVLLAEDNPVNRKLVTTLLEKRGHTVTAVENGRDALAATGSHSSGPFDVVLMDLQMPEMGGLEAAAAIRARESESDGPRLPLIALTAHAMAGDRERCLAGGLDGYLAKPIDVDELISTVERFGAGESAASREPGEPPAPADAVFDERAALSYTAGDRELLKEVITLFRSDYPSSRRAIEHALQERDSEALRLAAHRLKGAIATLGAPAGRQAAAQLEATARAGDFAAAARTYSTLRQEIERLDAALAAAGLVTRRARRSASASTRHSPRRKRTTS